MIEKLRMRAALDDTSPLEEYALALLERSTPPPAVVVLDLMMPGMDGFQVLEAIRRSEAWRDVPVVVVTAKDLTRDELVWLRTNAEEVFQKSSYDRRELIAVVHDLIARGVSVAGEPAALPDRHSAS
jgi:CheY-like chemotaxis protein